MKRNSPIKVGDRFKTKSFGEVEVVKYENCHKITVMFSDGTETVAESANIRTGEVRNRNIPSLHGVGYLSYGKFNAYANNKQTPEYRTWMAMMERCYGPTGRNPSYVDCTVHESWHNFQVFAEWYTTHRHYGKDFELDKDLTFPGNRQYGPDRCDLVPREVNLVLLDSGVNRRAVTGLPAGVSLSTYGKYVVQHGTGLGGSRKWKGTYSTREEAITVYQNAKEARAKFVANKYKDVLSPAVYKNLSEFKCS